MSGDAGIALSRAIVSNIVNFMNFEGNAVAEIVKRTDWASVTFTGARYRLRVEVQGPGAVGAAADFLERMPDVELAVPGHIVADVALLREERREGGGYARLELEALTVEDS